MSNSRLEKFIYAICGMEVDDLPTPLSRIETLWNCLITGEVPDFEPLSRNEKYLMAMLNDNVDGLPEPASRSEKILYKIATGETDLSDVPGYLSRYEELLKQLIENGGIGGTDFEYVLYTLNQPLSTLYTTAEGPVKSAILKGNTLVNLLAQNSSTNMYTTRTQIDRGYRYTQQYSASMTATRIQWDTTDEGHNRLKPNTKYYVQFTVKVNKSRGVIVSFEGGTAYTTTLAENSTTTIKAILQSPAETIKRFFVYVYPPLDESYTDDTFDILDFMTIEYQEGMENWDIPYFEGMQSVKMPVLTTTGKNLSPINDYETTVWEYAQGYQGFNKVLAKNILVNENKEYRLSFTKECENGLPTNLGGIMIQFSSIPADSNINDHNAVYVHCQNNKGKKYAHITMPNIGQGIEYVGKRVTLTNIQLEEGSVVTSCEPHKTNILTTPEEVVLRSLPNGVCDTLNLNTGEYVQRIGEITFDGSNDENWQMLTENSNWTNGMKNILTFYYPKPSNCALTWSKPGNELAYLSNKFPSVQSVDKYAKEDKEKLMFDQRNIKMAILKSKLNTQDLVGLQAYLQSNPITVQYELAEPIIKTVDLSILDQDGQPTKLKTFNDITHVSIEAEDLLPTVDLEVPTKIEETLSTLPTLMNDISETQQSLNEKIDAQAENINEVSTAITEIRSDIL